MTRIVVVPERLRELSGLLNATAEALRAQSVRLGGLMSQWDWESRHKAGVEGHVQQARSRANALADGAASMARYLLAKAQAFEAADGQGVAGLGEPSAACEAIRSQLEAAGISLVPRGDAASQLNLGSLLGKAGAAAAALPVAALPYLDKFVSLSLKGKTVMRRTPLGDLRPLAVDLRKNPFRQLKGGTFLGESLGFMTEFFSHPEDLTLHGAGVTGTKILLEKGLETIPHVRTAMIVSSLVQLGGGLSILGISESAKLACLDPSLDREVDFYSGQARESLEKLDLGKPVRSLATLIVDMQVQKLQYANDTIRSMVKQPSAESAARLVALSVPVWGDLVMAATDVKAHDILAQDGGALVKDVGNVFVGAVEAPFNFGQLLGISAIAYGSGAGEATRAMLDRGVVGGLQYVGQKVLEQL